MSICMLNNQEPALPLVFSSYFRLWRQARELGSPLVGIGNLRGMLLVEALDVYGYFWQGMADAAIGLRAMHNHQHLDI